MIHSAGFTALLDANVLYPAPLRDYLLNLAILDLYKPKWTAAIQDQWVRNLLLKRTDLKRESLKLACDAMDSAFPDSNITNYQELVNGLALPDRNDRHVLAAAIKGQADVIVTFNLKDFPADYLKQYDIEVQHPDEFITNLINLDITKALLALDTQVERLKNPPKSKEEIMQTLERCGLPKSMALLRTA